MPRLWIVYVIISISILCASSQLGIGVKILNILLLVIFTYLLYESVRSKDKGSRQDERGDDKSTSRKE